MKNKVNERKYFKWNPSQYYIEEKTINKKYTRLGYDMITSSYNIGGPNLSKLAEFYDAYVTIKLFWENPKRGRVITLMNKDASHFRSWFCLEVLNEHVEFFENWVKKIINNKYNFRPVSIFKRVY
jgi:hypothetical protein